MIMEKSLTDLRPGEKAVVTKLLPSSNMRRRLQDIGLIEGTEVECVGKSPLGDPTAYLIRKAVIALRKEDSEMVRVICVLTGGEDFGKRSGISQKEKRASACTEKM